ncbi:MAG: winged helix DNA-binding protein, partial [Ilumatobacteraceae bacterium]|nr:winged helix DNA-binding protein [Ilumatobacteraceae bacterium]
MSPARPAFTVDQRRARLARRHHLAPSAPAVDIAHAADDLVGLHATDAATVYLSAWARVPGLTVADVELALYDDLTVVRHLCMRRTLFVLPRELVAITQAAATDAVAAKMRKRFARELVDEGVTDDGDRWLNDVIAATVAAVVQLGPSTGSQLAQAVPLLRTQLHGSGPSGAAVTARVITLAAAEGLLERGRQQGSWTSSTHRWRMAGDRTGSLTKRDATVELVRRWLYSFGPAPTSDLMWWTGLGATEVNAALTALDVVTVDLDGHAGVVLIDDVDDEAPVEPWVALLPSLDPTPMGWKSREWYLGDHAARLFDRSGNVGPTVWSDGRIVGGWAVRRGEAKGTSSVVFELFDDIGRQATTAVTERAAQLQTWLEGVTVTPRFPT